MREELNTCWITVNRACNLRCFFCYAKNTNYSNQQTMTIEDAEKIVDFCAEAKITHIILIGGEPTIYKDLFELIEYCKLNKIQTSLVTNGIALSNLEYCNKLIKSGITNIDVSLKGSDKEEFKKITEFDKFDSVTQAIKNLVSLNFAFTCSMVITKENIDTFINGVDYIFSNGGKFVNLSFGYDFCMSETKDTNYLQKENPYELISKFTKQLDKLNNITKGNWSIECGFPLCVYSEEQLTAIGKNLTTGCQLLSGGGIIFDTDLNIIPCNTMFPIKMGKFGVDFNSYKQFCEYAEQPYYKNAREYLKSLPSEKCLTCEKQKYCGGGCVNFWTHLSFDDLENFKNSNKVKTNNNL